VQLDGTRWGADPVGPTVGFDPVPSAVGVLPAPAKREGVLGPLDEVGLIERRDDGVEVELEEREEGVVDVSRRDDE
jgi:hypothetical protein